MDFIPMWVQTTVLTYYIIWTVLEGFAVFRYVRSKLNKGQFTYSIGELKRTTYWWVITIPLVNFFVS